MQTRLWPSQPCLARVTDAINHSLPTAQGGTGPHIPLAPSTFTDTTPLSRPNMKRVHRGWEPILSARCGCQSSLTAGCSSGGSATLVPLNISCYPRLLTNSQLGQGAPGIYGRDPSELASCRSVEPQEQRYCLIVLINIVTRY